MTIGTFRYPGSKTRLAPWIIERFPLHIQYIEAFGGAASVLVAKNRSEMEVYNDLNRDCVKFFEAVRDHPNELSCWVKNTPTSRELFNQYVESYPDWPDDTVEYAGRFFFIQSHAFGGKGVVEKSPYMSISRANHDGGRSMEKIWARKPEQIKTLRDRLRGVQIECLDYADLVEKYDHKDAFFYFDPPYVDVGDDYYQVEAGGFDHERFVETVLDMDAKWLISYDQNIPKPLKDFYMVERTKVADISDQRPEKVETLTMNYDPNDTPMFREQEQQGLEAYE